MITQCHAAAALLALASFSFQQISADDAPYRQIPEAALQSERRDAGWRSEKYDPAAAALLREATTAVAEGDTDTARDLFEKAAAEHPELGLPALARFLRLSNDEDAIKAFEAGLLERNLSPTLLARIYKQLAQDDRAVEVLSGLEQSGLRPEAAITAARALDASGRSEDAIAFILNALLQSTNREETQILFHEFLTTYGERVVMQPEDFRRALNTGGGVITLHSEAATRLDPIIFRLGQSVGYFERRELFLQGFESDSPLLDWFRARMIVREEDFARAAALLDGALQRHPGNSLLLEARGELARSLGDVSGSRAIYEKLATAPDANPRNMMDAARAALAEGDLPTAKQRFMAINPDNLAADLRRVRALHLFQIAGAERDLPTIIDLYSGTAPNLVEDDIDFFHEVIFGTLIETEDHARLESEIRTRFDEDANTPAILWRLAAEAAAEARKTPNELEALYQGVLANSRDLAMLRRLANRATVIAEEIASVPKEALIVEPEVVDRVNELVDFSLRELIRLQPQDPTWAIAFLRHHAALGTSKPAEQLISALPSEHQTSARAIGVVAYALATNGHPAEALDLYDRALALDPGDMDLRMNRASCLTRLDRWDEARELYRQAIVDGYEGRNYHVHEMIGRLWSIEKHLGRTEEAIAWFKEVAPQLSSEWQQEALHDIGSLMANEQRPDDAGFFLRQLAKESDNQGIRTRAWQILATAYLLSGKPDQAESVLSEAIASTPRETIDYVMLMQNSGELFAEQKKHQEAIDQFVRIAAERPDSMEALSSYFRAAMIAQTAKDSAQMESLLQTFLQSDSTDFTLRREAQRLLEETNQ